MTAPNVFRELSEHLSRQDENYLTQSLAVVFNGCPRFRTALCRLLARVGLGSLAGLESDELVMTTRVGVPARNRARGRTRSVLDAIVMDGSRHVVASTRVALGASPFVLGSTARPVRRT